MKVIDLLNKIANGDRFENCKMKFKEIEPKEVNEYVIYDRLYEEDLTLNSEVEIIEEDKDIEKLKIEPDGSTYYIKNEHGTKCYLTKHSYLIADKINELIDEVNKLKGKYEQR